MKEKFADIKRKIFKQNFIVKSFFVVMLAIFFLFLVINQNALQFWANSYSKLRNCDLQVYFLDVGQANSTLIIFPSRMAMLVDAGSQESAERMLSDIDYILNENKIDEIEYLVLTHSDEDHVGGSVAVLDNYQVNNILRPKQLANFEDSTLGYTYVSTEVYQRTMETVYAEENCTKEFINDKIIRFGSAVVEIYSCQKDVYNDTNSFSPFISIEYSDKTFLLTGDATKIRENEFVDYLTDKQIEMKVDFLLVSHHGSKYSTTDDFLDAINPRLAFVSAGEDYYPSIEVKERLQKHSVEAVYSTNQYGMLAVGLKSDSSEEFIWNMKIYFDAPFVVVIASLVVFVFIKFLQGKEGKISLYRRDNVYLIKQNNV